MQVNPIFQQKFDSSIGKPKLNQRLIKNDSINFGASYNKKEILKEAKSIAIGLAALLSIPQLYLVAHLTTYCSELKNEKIC